MKLSQFLAPELKDLDKKHKLYKASEHMAKQLRIQKTVDKEKKKKN